MKLEKLTKDTIWNTIDYISSLGIFLVTTRLIIGEFGPDGYGFYVFFTSLVGLFGLVDLGMSMAVSKYLCDSLPGKDYIHSSEVINLALIFYSGLASLIVLTVFIFSNALVGFLRIESMYFDIGVFVIKLVSVVFTVNLISSVLTNILVALEQWVRISYVNIAFKILNATALIYITNLENFSLQEKFSMIFSSILALSAAKLGLLFFCVSLNAFSYHFVMPSRRTRIKVLSFLKFSSIQYFLSLIIGHLDKFIISRFFGLETLGVYSFCYSAFTYVYGFLSNCFKVFYPVLSRYHSQSDVISLKKWFFNLLIYSSCASLLVGIVLVLLWVPAVSAYIDSFFANESYEFILYFSVFLVVRSPELVMYYFFNATANPKVLVQNLMISAPIAFLLYFILVPWLGASGLIVSQVIGITVLYLWHARSIMLRGFDTYAFGRKVL
jgi:O-antigen/teichoic acid export membrane protein